MNKSTYLYSLCGLPFTGKTTLSLFLNRQLKIKRVAIDDINTERGIWDDEKGLSQEEWANTYREAYRRIDMLLAQEQSVLDDSANFTRELRNQLRRIASRYNVPTKVIYVNTPLIEIQKRRLANKQSALRGDVRDEDFATVINNFEPPTDDENVIYFDGSLSYDQWITEVFLPSIV